MAIIQEVQNGKIVEDTSESSSKKNGSKKNVGNTMGQEQFLQLLVAQMVWVHIKYSCGHSIVMEPC